jgi:hypothetical protein
MEIDLFQKNFVPVVRPSGMTLYGFDDLANRDRDGYVLKSTGEHFVYIEQLKEACRFGVSGVLAAYSNAVLHCEVTLTIGRITRIQIPAIYSGVSLRLVAAPKAAAIIGDVSKDECVFPHYQHSDNDSINITCSAFNACPPSFSPSYICSFYLAAASKDPTVNLLHDSLWHLSQNDANRAAIFLYASVEIAISKIVKNHAQGTISGKIHAFLAERRNLPEAQRNLLKKLKKKTDKFARIRGVVAHKGQHLTQDDLIPAYCDLIDLYAHYDELIADHTQG